MDLGLTISSKTDRPTFEFLINSKFYLLTSFNQYKSVQLLCLVSEMFELSTMKITLVVVMVQKPGPKLIRLGLIVEKFVMMMVL